MCIRDSNYVGTEHLLLGLLREQDGVAAQVLMNLGLKLEDVREEVLNLLGAGVGQVEDVDEDGMEPAGDAPPLPLVEVRVRPPRWTVLVAILLNLQRKMNSIQSLAVTKKSNG